MSSNGVSLETTCERPLTWDHPVVPPTECAHRPASDGATSGIHQRPLGVHSTPTGSPSSSTHTLISSAWPSNSRQAAPVTVRAARPTRIATTPTT